METQVVAIDAAGLDRRLPALSQILVETVADGAAISFLAPLPPEEATLFWTRDVRPEVAAGRRILLGAERGAELIGTVQLITAMPPNQPHRCELAKMMVHPNARRRGVGRALMRIAIERARGLGKTLITLDTRTGDVAEPLYASVGFEVAGVIPDFALNADGRSKHATTYMYHRL